MEMVDAGRPEAFLIPAIDFVTRAALRYCTLPQVQAGMPREMVDRALVAQCEAQRIVQGSLLSTLIADAYGIDGYLQRGLADPDCVNRLGDINYLGNKCASTFTEATFLISGARLALGARKLEPMAAGTIANRSRGLLLFARVPEGEPQESLIDYLGGLPYSDPERYDIDTTGRRPHADFTQSTRAYIESLLVDGRGCPAEDVPDRNKANLLSYTFGEMVHFLVNEQTIVTPGMTVEVE